MPHTVTAAEVICLLIVPGIFPLGLFAWNEFGRPFFEFVGFVIDFVYHDLLGLE